MSVNASLIDWEQLSGAEVPVTETPLVDPCPPQDSVPVSSPIVNYVVGGAVSLLGAAFLKNYQKVVTAYKVAPFFSAKVFEQLIFPFPFFFQDGRLEDTLLEMLQEVRGFLEPILVTVTDYTSGRIGRKYKV